MVSSRTLVGTSIGAVALVAWISVVFNLGPMMGMPSLPIDLVTLTLFVGAWTLGMVAMMFPTAVPMLLMFLHVGRSSTESVRAGGGRTPAKAGVLVGTYLGVWVATGVLFFVAAAVALSLLPLSTNLFIGTTAGVGVALLLVALYQLSPVKGECLHRCHPSSFLFQHYSGGLAGSAKMGLDYAKYCVGCCWVMMAFLLVSAGMGVVWMAVFAALIFVERNLSFNKWVPRALGVGFLAVGAVLLVP